MTDPVDLSQQAQQDALDALTQLHENGSGPAEIAPGEQRIISDFAEEFAEALMEGLADHNTSVAASVLSDTAKYYNKTDVQGQIQDAVEALDGTDKTPFDELIQRELREVKIVRTTDHKQDTLYRWNFAKCKLETRSGKDGRGHFHWSNFRDMYLEEAGEDPGEPTQGVRGGSEWREFIVSMIEEHGEDVENRGPRTTAVDDLANEIRTTTGYNDLREAVERDGIYVDLDTFDLPDWWAAGQPFEYERPACSYDFPHWWQGFLTNTEIHPPRWYGNGSPHTRGTIDLDPQAVTEIRVPNHIIKRICNTNELESTRALQVELDGRGYTVSRIPGVSEAAKVGGRKVSFWVLKPELAVPQVYENNPTSTMDAIDRDAERRERAEEAEGVEETGSAIDFVSGGDR